MYQMLKAISDRFRTDKNPDVPIPVQYGFKHYLASTLLKYISVSCRADNGRSSFKHSLASILLKSISVCAEAYKT